MTSWKYQIGRINYIENTVQQKRKSWLFLAPMQDPDELEYAEPPSVFKWIPICITPINPGTVTPAKNS